MEKKIKYLMLLVVIIIIILIIILVLLKKLEKKENLNSIDDEIYYSGEDIHFRSNIEKVTSKYEYFDTITCVEKYINTLNSLNTANYDENRNEVKETIEIYKENFYDLLDSKYKKQYNLTIENLDSKFSKYYKNLYFNVESMYVLDSEEEVAVYFVYGNLVDKDSKKTEEYGFVITRNTQNLTFSVLPYDYMKDKGYEEDKLGTLDLTELKGITVEQNEGNGYTSNAYDDEYISNYYFKVYKENLQYNTKGIYSKLSEEYKQKRFATLNEYEKYINSNFSELVKCNLNQYNMVENEDETKYICKDQFNNYYIFDEKNVGEYTILLDSYTTLDNEYAEKYNKATNEEKVSMNISKFFQMINCKDYNAAYKLLGENYKNNAFKTQSDFEKFIKSNLYSYNSVTLLSYSDKISGVYTYTVEIANMENRSDKIIKMNIVMELKEGTEFELSFQIID